MNVVETDHWSMLLAPEWWAELEEGTVVIADQDDVGCLEITTLLKDNNDFTQDDIEAVARDSDMTDSSAVKAGDFSGVYGAAEEEGYAIRQWVIAAANVLLFATYSCESEHAGMDDAAIDDLLGTLVAVSSAD